MEPPKKSCVMRKKKQKKSAIIFCAKFFSIFFNNTKNDPKSHFLSFSLFSLVFATLLIIMEHTIEYQQREEEHQQRTQRDPSTWRLYFVSSSRERWRRRRRRFFRCFFSLVFSRLRFCYDVFYFVRLAGASLESLSSQSNGLDSANRRLDKPERYASKRFRWEFTFRSRCRPVFVGQFFWRRVSSPRSSRGAARLSQDADSGVGVPRGKEKSRGRKRAEIRRRWGSTLVRTIWRTSLIIKTCESR